MTKETKEKRPPSHIIWQVIGDDDKARWTRIGAGWANKDGKGMNLRFNAYPVVGHIAVRVVGDREDREDGGQQ